MHLTISEKYEHYIYNISICILNTFSSKNSHSSPPLNRSFYILPNRTTKPSRNASTCSQIESGLCMPPAPSVREKRRSPVDCSNSWSTRGRNILSRTGGFHRNSPTIPCCA